jgi:predicted acyl esterase
VSSSNYPRYDRNPNTGGDIATETRAVTAKQIVFHEASALSRIVLPVIPR